ncbi:MAG TPA: TonB-dependent receptor [Rhizomicrobium sp.]|nr:TonB-dependent receptor [Rhizomicrobium sp.]
MGSSGCLGAFSRWAALRSVLVGGVAVLSISAAAAAQDSQIDLREQPLSDALRSVARSTGESILFTPESVDGLRAPAISGRMNAQQAVSMLTQGTDLEIVSDGTSGLIVRRPFMRHAVAQAPAAAGGGGQPVESVVVSGFRSSLEQSLDMKRSALDSSDSILAEDIAKFPDLNVSESLQRIPGITLARDQGEGRQISVRGLNSTFTRVRINGMEALATTGSEDVSGGANRGRSFDFNVFASELFSQLTVHKTASAEVEEGSLGATVDLHTAHPFDKPGFNLVTSAQAGYNDLSGGFNPRVAGLISDTFLGGRLGFLFSGAYQIQNGDEVGASTVRWQNDNTAQNAAHSSPYIAGCVTNVPAATSQCATGQRLGYVAYNPPAALAGTNPAQTFTTASATAPNRQTVGAVPNGANYNAAALPNNYDVVNEAFRPRFPRYDDITNHEKRLGLTGSAQWQPDDATLFTLDALFADFAVVRNEYYLEAESFSNNNVSSTIAGLNAPILGAGSIGVLNYAVDPATNNLNYVQAANVGLRSEHRVDHLDTRFTEVTLDASHDFSDALKIHGLFGFSQSNHNNPIQTTLTMDYDCTAATSLTGAVSGCPGGAGGGAGTLANPYSFDYRGGLHSLPALTYGNVDVTSTNGWFLSQIRERENFVHNSYRTIQADFDYKPFDWAHVKGGIDYKNYGYSAVITARTNGTTASQDNVIPAAMETPAVLAANSQLTTLHGLNVGTGTPTVWAVPNIDAFNNQFHIFDPTAFTTVQASGGAPCNVAPGCGAFQQGPGQFLSQNGIVHENDVGGWLQADWDAQFYGVPFRGNIGARYVETTQDAVGYSFDPLTKSVITSTVSRTYHDFLPSINTVLEPADNFLIRVSGAYVMARPDLGNLLPGGATATVTGSNFNVTENNPSLNPYRAKTVDMSFEWYYHKGALLSIAFFYKHLDSLVQTLRQNIPFNTNTDGVPDSLAVAACGVAYVAPPASGCNEAAIWSFTKPVNSKGAPLYGTEIAWQQPFDFLPDPFSNLGFTGNVTFVQATQTYYNADGSVLLKTDLTGLSHTSYSATLYYDDGTLEARGTASFRSKYIPNSGVNPGNLNDLIINDSTLNIDASASYRINDNFTLTFDGINLTNQPTYQYVDSTGRRLYYNHYTGSNYFVGLRYSY